MNNPMTLQQNSLSSREHWSELGDGFFGAVFQGSVENGFVSLHNVRVKAGSMVAVKMARHNDSTEVS